MTTQVSVRRTVTAKSKGGGPGEEDQVQADQKRAAGSPAKVVRCAVYTRKSSEEGLEQQFNSLDAQRDRAELYIASQKGDGWVCLPERYDDGGFTGGNTDRPALQRLMADIEAGKIDCVVVYKVDRLSRSLLDFARLMGLFDSKGVSFVSVTQQFNSTHSMGRLTLNILLSFAQFEREIISERTRDKIASSRRKGLWFARRPMFGYDLVAPAPGLARKLVVNPAEAELVREIFAMYLGHKSVLRICDELNGRGVRTKEWVSSQGRAGGGRAWDKQLVLRVLRHPLYIGKVEHNGELFDGQHEAIVDPEHWRAVGTLLKRNAASGGGATRNSHGALLKGLLRCGPCGCVMGHTYSIRKQTAAYRYYLCQKAQKQGRSACPGRALPAESIERLVVERLAAAAVDPAMVAAAYRHLARESASLGRRPASPATVAGALSRFEEVWELVPPRERAAFVALLVERVEYDPETSSISITLHEAGLPTLGQEPLGHDLVDIGGAGVRGGETPHAKEHA